MHLSVTRTKYTSWSNMMSVRFSFRVRSCMRIKPKRKVIYMALMAATCNAWLLVWRLCMQFNVTVKTINRLQACSATSSDLQASARHFKLGGSRLQEVQAAVGYRHGSNAMIAALPWHAFIRAWVIFPSHAILSVYRSCMPCACTMRIWPNHLYY